MLSDLLALALIAGLGMMPGGHLMAQTFTVLHSFTATDPSTLINNDGAGPYAQLVVSGNTLYGTASDGGSSGNGTVFKVNTDGSGFTVLHNFAPSGASDGGNPRAGLFLSENVLYGTAPNGGSSGNGTVFKLNTNGTGFLTLHRFTGSDGAGPRAVVVAGNTVYGMAQYGGSSGNGTVYKVDTNGTGFTNLHHFTATSGSPATNSDGAAPYRELLLSGNTLYGTARDGGCSGNGTVFKLNTDGSGITTLYSFTSTPGPFLPNNDGASPYDGLSLAGDILYGTAGEGGSTGNGTVFTLNKDGTGFTNLYNFTAVPDENNPPYINEDGATPVAGLFLSGNTLYGTTQAGGISGNGALFAVNTDGSGFTNLHSFAAGPGSYPLINNSDGVDPVARLVLSGNTLYGTAEYGGPAGNGTIFRLSFPPPPLTVTPSGANVILSWPTGVPGFSYGGYALQVTVNLDDALGWVTTLLPEPPVIVNGRYVVTMPNTIGRQHFYRLSQ
jgi:uncharacterized repeat protein (TIGR03803 family)